MKQLAAVILLYAVQGLKNKAQHNFLIFNFVKSHEAVPGGRIQNSTPSAMPVR